MGEVFSYSRNAFEIQRSCLANVYIELVKPASWIGIHHLLASSADRNFSVLPSVAVLAQDDYIISFVYEQM